MAASACSRKMYEKKEDASLLRKIMLLNLLLAAVLAVGLVKGDGWRGDFPKPKTIEKFSLKDVTTVVWVEGLEGK